jgi:tRNA(Ser,Leu) C12 N-acetylase TAN1
MSSVIFTSVCCSETTVRLFIGVVIADTRTHNDSMCWCDRLETKCKNIVFVRAVEETFDPPTFLSKVFSFLKETSTARTRFTNRVLPIQMTCPAEIHIILKTIVPLLRNFFQQKDNKRLKFKVELRIRNNNSVSKSTLLPEVVKLVGRPHVVDLNSPDTLIIIEIFRHCCCLAVVDAAVFPNFNIRSLTASSQATTERQTKNDDENAATRKPIQPNQNESDCRETSVKSLPQKRPSVRIDDNTNETNSDTADSNGPNVEVETEDRKMLPTLEFEFEERTTAGEQQAAAAETDEKDFQIV